MASLMSPEIRPVPVWASPADAVIRVSSSDDDQPAAHMSPPMAGIIGPVSRHCKRATPVSQPFSSRPGHSGDLIQASHSSQTAVNGRPPRESVIRLSTRRHRTSRSRAPLRRGQSLRVDQVEDERAAHGYVTFTSKSKKSRLPSRATAAREAARRIVSPGELWRSMPFSGASGFPGVDSSGARPRCPQ